MNWGLAERDTGYDWVRAEDKLYQYHLGLVRHALRDIDLTERAVLEIGSGRGGNCYYLSSYANAGRVYGVDSSLASTRAAGNVRGSAARFVCADIAALPFAGNAFDVLLNIDGSPSYPALSVLLAEVARVLKPGGVFVTMDLWSQDARGRFRTEPFEVVHDEDITDGMLRALQQLDGLDELLRNIENDTNRELIEDIRGQQASIRRSLTFGVCSARITRLVKA